jgi:hypothetical protein
MDISPRNQKGISRGKKKREIFPKLKFSDHHHNRTFTDALYDGYAAASNS